MSNHTDFQRLTSALWIQRPLRRQFDLVILPGSKNSVADLQWMREQKFDLWLREQYAAAARTFWESAADIRDDGRKYRRSSPCGVG